MSYELEQPKPRYLRLKETLTGSVVRLQTNDPLLTETFWNHYHSDRDKRRHARKRKFTEVDGANLIEATEVFGRALSKAQDNAPFGSEIYKAIDKLWDSVRHVQITLTGDPEYGRAPIHSTHNNPPPKEVKLRSWDTIPLWKEQAAKK